MRVCEGEFSFPDNMNEAPAEKTSCVRAIGTKVKERQGSHVPERSAGTKSCSFSFS